MFSCMLLPLLSAVAPIVIDPLAHSVSFAAHATDVAPGTILEFAFVGPNSDRSYEAMFVTEASVSDLARAFDQAGIQRGRPVCQDVCRFWPVGQRIEFKPALSEFISNMTNDSATVLYTGGRRNEDDCPLAETNMPSAVFALYSLDQSLLLSADSEEQSMTYGRFTSLKQLQPNTRIVFTVSWNGTSNYTSRRLELNPKFLQQAIASLKTEPIECDVLPVFSSELTAAEATAAAKALAVIDSRKICINGFADGQFYYRGFIPDEKWRDRTKRLTQPLEVRVAGAGTNVVCTVIDEDWSTEGDEPALHPHDEPIGSVIKGFNNDTCLFFVRSDTRIGLLFSLMKQLPKVIRNWYVFID